MLNVRGTNAAWQEVDRGGNGMVAWVKFLILSRLARLLLSRRFPYAFY